MIKNFLDLCRCRILRRPRCISELSCSFTATWPSRGSWIAWFNHQLVSFEIRPVHYPFICQREKWEWKTVLPTFLCLALLRDLARRMRSDIQLIIDLPLIELLISEEERESFEGPYTRRLLFEAFAHQTPSIMSTWSNWPTKDAVIIDIMLWLTWIFRCGLNADVSVVLDSIRFSSIQNEKERERERREERRAALIY